MSQLEAQVRTLRTYVLLLTVLMLVFGISAFTLGGVPQKVEELTVERINIVEPDGKLRLVIANKPRSPAIITRDGRTIGTGGSRGGLIFYNDEGGEIGGLIFSGRRDTTGAVTASGHLSFDQYEQDQVIALQYIERGGTRYQGLTVLDRPNPPLIAVLDSQRVINAMPAGPAKDSAWRALAAMQGNVPFGAPRVFVGRDRNRSSTLELKDLRGRTKFRAVVDSLGEARLEFLNDSGRVVRSVP